jgi:hypothetical protein
MNSKKIENYLKAAESANGADIAFWSDDLFELAQAAWVTVLLDEIEVRVAEKLVRRINLEPPQPGSFYLPTDLEIHLFHSDSYWWAAIKNRWTAEIVYLQPEDLCFQCFEKTKLAAVQALNQLLKKLQNGF